MLLLKLQGGCYGASTLSFSSTYFQTRDGQFGDKNVGNCVDADDDGKNSKEKDNENTIVYGSKNVGGVGIIIEVDDEKVYECRVERRKQDDVEDLNQNDDDDNHEANEVEDDGDEDKKKNNDDGDEQVKDDDSNEEKKNDDNNDDDNEEDEEAENGPDKDNIILNEGNVGVENIENSSGSGDKGDEEEVEGECVV
ncbi:Prostatic spermine-binding protein precursor, putative [Ricinus communis]|uniref:Prostatic spermine-binding protein, putative n=1 Tax=Ricinus communis TaxID=3988 RepID=B9RYK9_RICCO|nr:Prostatic spermine-binding protein precursor, putative [Ricinus communis]